MASDRTIRSIVTGTTRGSASGDSASAIRNSIRPRRRWTRRRIVVAALLVVFVVGPAIGWTYEQYAVRRDRRLFPAPGQFLDVGGRRLHYVCSGSGTPLVLFEVSGFSNAMSFHDARAGVARRTRVCSYDRMGIGWSDPGPSAIPAGMLADDLRRLLDTLSPREPAIVVASSIGGVPAEMFARRHPARVAGLVFLDAGNSEAVARLPERDISLISRPVCRALQAASAIGLVRLFDPWRLRQTRESARSAAVMYGSKPWVMLCAMVRAGNATIREFASVPQLPRDLPVTALSAETREAFMPPAIADWVQIQEPVERLRETHRHLAGRSSRGVWRVVPGSDHLIASSQPQAVIEAVLDIIDRHKP
jgi:pimeloyl-ACP methyl ester carboxylesterase